MRLKDWVSLTFLFDWVSLTFLTFQIEWVWLFFCVKWPVCLTWFCSEATTLIYPKYAANNCLTNYYRYIYLHGKSNYNVQILGFFGWFSRVNTRVSWFPMSLLFISSCITYCRKPLNLFRCKTKFDPSGTVRLQRFWSLRWKLNTVLCKWKGFFAKW